MIDFICDCVEGVGLLTNPTKSSWLLDLDVPEAAADPLTHRTPKPISSIHMDRRLLPRLLAQVGVGDGRFRESNAVLRGIGGGLADCVLELLIDSWVLSHVGG